MSCQGDFRWFQGISQRQKKARGYPMCDAARQSSRGIWHRGLPQDFRQIDISDLAILEWCLCMFGLIIVWRFQFLTGFHFFQCCFQFFSSFSPCFPRKHILNSANLAAGIAWLCDWMVPPWSLPTFRFGARCRRLSSTCRCVLYYQEQTGHILKNMEKWDDSRVDMASSVAFTMHLLRISHDVIPDALRLIHSTCPNVHLEYGDSMFTQYVVYIYSHGVTCIIYVLYRYIHREHFFLGGNPLNARAPKMPFRLSCSADTPPDLRA